MKSKQTSELTVGLPWMPWTLKKTAQLIVEGSNDYLVTVKENQPRLLAQMETLTQQAQPQNRFVEVEKTRERITCRIVNIFTDTTKIDRDWAGVQSLIQVERIGMRAGKRYQQTNYYISSLLASATEFALKGFVSTGKLSIGCTGYWMWFLAKMPLP